MLKTVYTKSLITEHSATQITYLKYKQLLLLVTIKPTVSNLKMYYNFIGDVVINKHNAIYTNGNTNVTTTSKLVNSDDMIWVISQRK